MQHRLTALILIVALSATACVPNRMYRRNSIQPEPDYTLAYIEFDDQGEMWAPKQLKAALETIEKANEHPNGALVMLFIHGWQHSAAPREEEIKKGNIKGFRVLLDESILAAKEADPKWDKEVVGVYLGWRGRSSRIPLISSLTFYGRGRAAKRVAQVSATEAIVKIMTASSANPRAQTILIGHSFGGRIMERALTQTIVGSVLATRKEEIDFPADAIILVNPASQAILAKQFVEAMNRSRIKLYRTDREGRKFEVPLMVSVTSTGDQVTGLLFPAGIALSVMSGNFRKYGDTYCAPLPRQRTFYRNTAGHVKALHSHVVTGRPLNEEELGKQRGGFDTEVTPKYDPDTKQWGFSFRSGDNEFMIEPIPRAWNDTPYWIMSVPRSLILDHSAIFNPNTVRLIAAILEITGALQPQTGITIVRETGIRPLGLLPAGDENILFLDQSRELYRVGSADALPSFVACLPSEAHPSEQIGFSPAEGGGVAVLNWPVGRGEKQKYRTEFIRFAVTDGEPETRVLAHFKYHEPFTAAAFDAVRDRIFLASGQSAKIFTVDRKTPKPRPWAELPDTDSTINRLLYDPSSDRLYAVDGKKGTLYAMDAGAETPPPRLVAEGLGWPTDITAAPTGRLYITDAKEKQIWTLDCSAEAECSRPSRFTTTDAVVDPTLLTVSDDGTLWVGDLEAEKIFAFSPQGELKQVLDRLPQE